MLLESASTRLRTQLDSLATVLQGASANALERRPVSGKWSARENLAHLARYQIVFLERLQRIRDEDRPRFGRYRAEDDPEWGNWIDRPAEDVLRELRVGREEIVRAIESLSEDGLRRVGVHPRFGEMTVAEWLEFFLLHEAHHLLAVFQRVRERDATP